MRNGHVYVSFNEDWSDPNTKIWSEKGTDSTYAIVWLGYESMPRQSAINEMGLVFDVFTVPEREVELIDDEDFDGEKFKTDLMSTCATVLEVIQFIRSYDMAQINGAQLMFADRTGSSVIVEADTMIFQLDKDYQIVTNFNQSQIATQASIECKRYLTADSILNKDQRIGMEYCKNILQEISFKECSGTQYSVIYDLTEMKIHLFLFHNFNEIHSLDVNQIFKEREIDQSLSSLFIQNSNYLAYKEAYNNGGNIIKELLECNDELVFDKLLKDLGVYSELCMLDEDLYLVAKVKLDEKQHLLHDLVVQFYYDHDIRGFAEMDLLAAQYYLRKDNFDKASYFIKSAINNREIGWYISEEITLSDYLKLQKKIEKRKSK